MDAHDIRAAEDEEIQRGSSGVSQCAPCLGAAAAEPRVLDVAHLRAREVEARAVRSADLHDGLVPVPLRNQVPAPRVVVPRRQLRGVRPRVIPPVHPRALDRQLHPRAGEHTRRAPQHAVPVVHQLAAVPRQEELPVRRVPRPLMRAEETRLMRQVVVPAGVVRPRPAPLYVPSRRCGVRQIPQGALVVTLELADPGELPLARVGRDLVLRIRRISKLKVK